MMKLEWKKMEEDELFGDNAYSLKDENNIELIWLYYETDRWVVCFTDYTPIREVKHYKLNENSLEDVKFRAILELQYEFDKKAREYFKYCDCISEMTIKYLQDLNDADK